MYKKIILILKNYNFCTGIVLRNRNVRITERFSGHKSEQFKLRHISGLLIVQL